MIYTVNQLFYECKKQIELGNGGKEIYISIDEEGNGFHPLYFSFTSEKEDIEDYYNQNIVSAPSMENIILLG